MTADDMTNECLRCWLVDPLLPNSLDSLIDPTSGAHGEETSWDSGLLDGSSLHQALAPGWRWVRCASTPGYRQVESSRPTIM